VKSNLLNRLFTAIASFSLLLNSLGTPLLAIAQEVTPTPTPDALVEPTPTDSATPTPDATPTIEPTTTPTATPDITPTPDVSPTPTVEVTPTPTDEVTPSPTDEAVVSPAPETTPTTPGPPSDSTPTPDSTTPAPSPSATPEVPQEHGNVSATLLHQTEAASVTEDSLGLAQTDSSATLITDKPDYAPTDAVVITGTGFIANKTYTIEITSQDAPAVDFKDQVKANDKGDLFYTYQLDGNYRPNYKVEVLSGNTVVASVTFTDSAKITIKDHEGQNSDNSWTNGNVTEYKEGDYINFRFKVKVEDAPATGKIQIRFTGDDGTCLFFDNYFSLGTTTNISGSTPVVTFVSGPTAENFGTSNGEWKVILAISGTSNGEGRTSYTLRLSQSAGECNGSSQHSRLDNVSGPDGGDVSNMGALNIPVHANQIIELPEITAIKHLDRNGDGVFEDTADAGEFCFALDGGTCISTDSSGQITFSNVTPNGAHSITETQLNFSQGTYAFVSGSGINCKFNGSTATATVASGTTATDASCTFNNGLATGTLRVVKSVTNDSGGQATASAFTLHVKSGGVDVSGSPAAGSSTGTVYTLNAGSYVVSENTPPAGYTQTGFSGNCDGNGNVTVVAGQEKTCTITNDDTAPALHLRKTITADNGGTASAADWTLTATGTGGSPTNLSGSTPVNSGSNFKADTYALAESGGPSGYTAGAWDCVGGTMGDATHVTLALGESANCTINNNDIAPTITLIKVVMKDNGGTAGVNDFGLMIDGNNVDSGVATPVDANTSISLDENGLAGYSFVSMTGEGCPTQLRGTVTLSPGQDITCTITNDDIAPTLKLVKNVTNDNGGTNVAHDWSLGAAGTGGFTDFGDSTTFHTVKAGVGYVLSESDIAGYTAGNWNCNGDSLQGDTLTLGLQEDVTCSISNNDNAPSLTLVKVVANNNGGNATETDWTLTATGPTGFSGTGPSVSNGPSFDAGTYVLSESGLGGYTASNWVCNGGNQTEANTVVVGLGDQVTCTITNDDIVPTVTLNKEVRGGDAGENDFGLTIGGQGVDSGQTVDVDANTPIALDEAGLDGYSFDSITGEGCPSELGGTVTLDEGGGITCTIVNTRDTGDILGYKFEDLNGNGNWDEGEPGLEGWTIELWGGQENLIDTTETSDDPLGQYSFENIPTGDYAVCEVLKDGWTQTYPEGCHFITLTQEGEQGLNFGNFKLAAIGDFIWHDNNGDGVQDVGEPGIAGIDVNLYQDDGDGIFEPGTDDPLVGTDTTNGSGGYLFENLGPGQYWTDVVDSTLPAGFANTTPDPVGPIILSSGETYLLADVGYVAPEIKISKSNDKPNSATGDTVTYTLTVINTFDTSFDGIIVKDVLPGGFSYVNGSTTIDGSSAGDPNISGGVLEWTINEPEFPITITYKATIGNDLSNGTYKNFATCTAFITRKETEQECNVADSSVTLGAGQGYGGNLTPQVLGASTELPATGNDTGLLLFTIAAIIGGVAIKVYGKRKYGKN